VFPHDKGGPLNHGILLRSGFHPALRRAKLRHIRFHDLRHTFASLLIHANVHPKRIQTLMGHSTIRITMDVTAT
jgi:integrase